MKKTLKVLSLTLASMLSLSCVAGCGDKATEESFVPKYEPSGYKLVNGGVSEYVVLLPEAPTSNEYTAAEELTYFMKAATGAELPVVHEGTYTVSESSAIISIGETSYADSKGVKTDGTLDTSGYVMKTVNNQLFIRSDGDGLGCVYGVYDLLESAVGYRYYHTTEIYYDHKETVDLYKYDVVADPDFDFRAISTWNAFLYSNEDYMRRTRTFRKDEGWAWHGEMHLQARKVKDGVLNPDVWLESHKFGTTKTVTDENGVKIEVPDHWYAATNDQPCWTAGEEMYEQAARDIFAKIQDEPDKVYFGVGQADVTNFCDCERCEEAKADWALNDAGLQMHFINRVADYVNTWVAEKYPERKIRLVVFAYYATEEAPVVKGADGKWKPFSEKVVPTADNIDFYFAPIYTDYSKTLLDAENATVYSNLIKWQDFLEGRKNQFLLYTYDTNFHYFFYNFNNFDTFAEQARVYAEHGVDFIHSQGANNNNQPGFPEMRYFVESQILWDTSKNYNELVDEFMLHFYKDAYAEIREYYDFTRFRYEQMQILHNMKFADIYADIGNKEIWTKSVVRAMDDIFERAYKKIEHYQTTDSEMYEKLHSRIKELELTVLYTKLKNYPDDYTQAQKNLMVDEFNSYVLKFDINVVKEGGTSTSGLFDHLKK